MFPIPTVLTAQEVLDVAFRRAAKKRATGRTPTERGRRASVAKVQALADTIEAKLRSYVKAVPDLDRLSDFHRELVDVVVGLGKLRHDLGAIDWCATQVVRLCRRSAREAGRAPAVAEAVRIRKAAYGRVSSLVERIAPNLEALAAAREKLIRIPDLDPEVPTIAVAGYPNVGKSQFVRAVSSGKPRVAVYPFTTKGINVGHVEHRRRRYQVVDTPGLLDRPMEERNVIERQAIVALRHLADVIVFLFDPSEMCGYPMAVQERLLEEVRTAFPGVPMVEADNKADVLRADSGRKRVSALTGEGCVGVLEIALAAVTRASS